ncbi:hypothetical protein M011DRAFT_474823 [Sporormia fimetaria CBS 119925]|uniref:Uncharacterized protein n=1 Tax=Sporormia fimetaria CBS 119925 TaxID=1340428 RepID=A0A6A6VKX5_9PLEO|nr:hypothetical protein M011DRAFT_474823 [Sporormia fimetaria CBS 119925]
MSFVIVDSQACLRKPQRERPIFDIEDANTIRGLKNSKRFFLYRKQVLQGMLCVNLNKVREKLKSQKQAILLTESDMNRRLAQDPWEVSVDCWSKFRSKLEKFKPEWTALDRDAYKMFRYIHDAGEGFTSDENLYVPGRMKPSNPDYNERVEKAWKMLFAYAKAAYTLIDKHDVFSCRVDHLRAEFGYTFEMLDWLAYSDKVPHPTEIGVILPSPGIPYF